VLTFCPKWEGMFTEEDFVGWFTESIGAAVFCAWISCDFLKISLPTELPTDWPDDALTDEALEISMAVSHLNLMIPFKYSTEWFYVRQENRAQIASGLKNANESRYNLVIC